MKIEEKSFAEFVVDQAVENGVSVTAVSDGHVFIFTEGALRDLLEAAEGPGKAVLFVKHGVRQ